jgi:hypothetical protein
VWGLEEEWMDRSREQRYWSFGGITSLGVSEQLLLEGLVQGLNS